MSNSETLGTLQQLTPHSDKRVTVLYSDGRDGKNAQKVSQQSTADMWDDWGKATDVAVPAVATDLQGTASVAQVRQDRPCCD